MPTKRLDTLATPGEALKAMRDAMIEWADESDEDYEGSTDRAFDTDFGTAVDVDMGLKNGDKVIDNPPDSLRAGDLIRVAQPLKTMG